MNGRLLQLFALILAKRYLRVWWSRFDDYKMLADSKWIPRYVGEVPDQIIELCVWQGCVRLKFMVSARCVSPIINCTFYFPEPQNQKNTILSPTNNSFLAANTSKEDLAIITDASFSPCVAPLLQLHADSLDRMWGYVKHPPRISTFWNSLCHHGS